MEFWSIPSTTSSLTDYCKQATESVAEGQVAEDQHLQMLESGLGDSPSRTRVLGGGGLLALDDDHADQQSPEEEDDHSCDTNNSQVPAQK